MLKYFFDKAAFLRVGYGYIKNIPRLVK